MFHEELKKKKKRKVPTGSGRSIIFFAM